MANAKTKPVVRKAPSKKPAINAEKVRDKELAASAFALVNADNTLQTAEDAVTTARRAFYNLTCQTYGKNWFEKKETSLAPKMYFYRAHFESKNLQVVCEVNSARAEIKSNPVNGADAEQVKQQADNAKGRFRQFLAWCEKERDGKHAEKNPNSRQSKTTGRRTLAEIVQDAGSRIYNACYKAGNKTACADLQAWATKYAKGVKFAVPAGAK